MSEHHHTSPAGHGHPGHHHHTHGGDERRLFWVMVLTGGFMVAEVVGGVLAGSLALLADAGHMLTDSASLALAWLGFRIARRPADDTRTYGYHRFQVLAAFVNGLSLLAIALWILVEAVERLLSPVEVVAGIMLIVAAAGLAVNVVGVILLHGGSRENLNVKGALAHVMGDLLGSVAALIAGGVILVTAWTPIDPLLSIVVAGLLVRTGLPIVRQAGHILLEGAPAGLDPAQIGSAVTTAVPGVEGVHHVHAWSLTAERPMVTLHAVIDERANGDGTRHSIERVLAEKFGVDHATVQIERHCCDAIDHSGGAGHHHRHDPHPA